MASCSSFQSKVGAPDADTALLRIPVLIDLAPPVEFDPDLPPPTAVPRPRAIVAEPGRMAFGRNGYITNTDVVVQFEIDVPEQYKKDENSIEGPAPQELIIEINNWAGLVTKELMLLTEEGQGHPYIHGGEKMDRAVRTMPEEDGDYMRLLVRFKGGIRGASGGMR
jgi:hypothetical protein